MKMDVHLAWLIIKRYGNLSGRDTCQLPIISKLEVWSFSCNVKKRIFSWALPLKFPLSLVRASVEPDKLAAPPSMIAFP